MKLREGTPTADLTIGGQKFKVPSPYREGDTLNGNEAATLNQTFRENIRNNFASVVEKAGEDAQKSGGQIDLHALQSELEGYVAEYEFGAVRGGGVRMDPVEKEARGIARQRVVTALENRMVDGRPAPVKQKDVSAEKMKELVDQVISKYPEITEQARSIVAARQQAVGQVDLGDLGQVA